jgi:ethanolamine utilization microcompartment shell protein EutS
MLLAIAMACGAVPLVIGVLIALGYLLTRRGMYMHLGFLTILAGTVLVAGGAACLFTYWWDARRTPALARSTLHRQVIWTSALLAANFPTAAVCCAIGLSLPEQITLRFAISNASTTAVTNMVLTTPVQSISVRTLAPGEDAKVSLRADGAGSGDVMYRFVMGGTTHSGVAIESVDADDAYSGSVRTIIVIHDDGVAID